jgi:hypothetical protein
MQRRPCPCPAHARVAACVRRRPSSNTLLCRLHRFAALEEAGAQAADIAAFFGGVLQEEAGADPAERARALAGLAMCALIDDPPNLETARDLVNNAKEVGRGYRWGGSPWPAGGSVESGCACSQEERVDRVAREGGGWF